jgi:hypothetical protein
MPPSLTQSDMLKKSNLLATAGIASALAAMEKDMGYVSFDEMPKEPEPMLFTIRNHRDFGIDYSPYNKDLPNLRKHRETCLKNRKKRKAKKRSR